MGNMQATGMAEAIKKDWIDLGIALHWHLTSNHYPPLPIALIETAKTAIERANTGDFDSEIELPDGVAFRGKTTVSVSEAIEGMHLDAYIDWSD